MTALDEYWALWLQLDAMTEEQFEGAEADAIRDRMDGPWYRMSKDESAELQRRAKERDAASEVKP